MANISDDEVLERRKLIVEWWEYACGWPEAREVLVTHERYIRVVEGRKNSSCGDLPQWGWYRVGVRLPWLNRKEGAGYRYGLNISRIVTHSEPYVGQELDGGDVIVISNMWQRFPGDKEYFGQDSHAVCVCAVDGIHIATAEYGQPGGALKQCVLNGDAAPLKLRTVKADDTLSAGRVVRTVLKLETIIREAATADLLLEPDRLQRAP